MEWIKEPFLSKKNKEIREDNLKRSESFANLLCSLDRQNERLLKAIGIIRTCNSSTPYHINCIEYIDNEYIIIATSYHESNGLLDSFSVKAYTQYSISNNLYDVFSAELQLVYNSNNYHKLVHAVLNIETHPKYTNRGYGSIVMRELLKIAVELEIPVIIGRLIPTVKDSDHQQRLHHFYKKFGFEISTDDRIILTIE